MSSSRGLHKGGHLLPSRYQQFINSLSEKNRKPFNQLVDKAICETRVTFLGFFVRTCSETAMRSAGRRQRTVI